MGQGHRPDRLHRLPRLHDGLQVRERRSPRRHPHVREVRRRGHVPPGPAGLPGDPLQPVRGRSLRGRLPDGGHVPAPRRDRRLRQAHLHRLQGLHGRLPLRRHLHQPRRPLGREVQLLRPPPRHRPGTGLRRGLPHPGDHGRATWTTPPRPWPADRRPAAGGGAPARRRRPGPRSSTGAPIRPRSIPWPPAAPTAVCTCGASRPSGPGQVGVGHPGGRGNSSAAAVLAYDVSHRAPWDWRVSLYTWTKGIAAGAWLVAVALALTGTLDWSGTLVPGPLRSWRSPSSAVTGGLLIWDLEHPGRFCSSSPGPSGGRGSSGAASSRRLRRRPRPPPPRCVLDAHGLARAAAVPGVPLATHGRRLHRLPVRPGQGPRPLAEPAPGSPHGRPGRPGRRRRAPAGRRRPRRRRRRRTGLGPGRGRRWPIC